MSRELLIRRINDATRYDTMVGDILMRVGTICEVKAEELARVDIAELRNRVNAIVYSGVTEPQLLELAELVESPVFQRWLNLTVETSDAVQEASGRYLAEVFS